MHCFIRVRFFVFSYDFFPLSLINPEHSEKAFWLIYYDGFIELIQHLFSFESRYFILYSGKKDALFDPLCKRLQKVVY